MTARWWAAAVVAVAVLAGASPARAQKAVFLVRHAEKVDESRDPLLSDDGNARARALARHLAAVGVTAIYVTEYQRTALTAAPLAAATALKPIVVAADDRQRLADRIRKDHPDGVVLVVGHSNTVPEVLRLLGHREPVTIAASEYGSLFVLVPAKAGAPTVLRLQY